MTIPATDPHTLSIRRAALENTAASLQLGNGICTLGDITRGIAVEGNEQNVEHGVDYQAAIVQCTSLEEIRTHLSISASVSFKSLGMKGSASFNFLHNKNFSRYDCHLIAQFNYAARKMAFVGDPKLKHGAFTGSVSDFYRQYGDEYVHTIEYGGSLLLIFTYHATSFEEIKTFRSFASAKVGKMKASTAIDTSFQKFAKDGKLSLAISSVGLDAQELPIGKSLKFDEALMDEIVKFIRSAPLRVDEESTNVIGIETRPYINLDKKFFAIENKIAASKRSVVDLAEFREKGSQLEGDLDFIIENPALFDTDPDKVDELRSLKDERLHDVLKRIDRQAEIIWLDPWHTGILEDMKGEVREIAKLRPKEKVVPEPFIVAEFTTFGHHTRRVVLSDDPDSGDWVGYSGQPIVQMRVWCDPKIDGAELVVQATSNHGGGVTTEEGQWVPVNPDPVFKIGFWLVGESADLYDVRYGLLTNKSVADGFFIGNLGEMHGHSNGNHGVERVHIAVKRKGTWS